MKLEDKLTPGKRMLEASEMYVAGKVGTRTQPYNNRSDVNILFRVLHKTRGRQVSAVGDRGLLGRSEGDVLPERNGRSLE